VVGHCNCIAPDFLPPVLRPCSGDVGRESVPVQPSGFTVDWGWGGACSCIGGCRWRLEVESEGVVSRSRFILLLALPANKILSWKCGSKNPFFWRWGGWSWWDGWGRGGGGGGLGGFILEDSPRKHYDPCYEQFLSIKRDLSTAQSRRRVLCGRVTAKRSDIIISTLAMPDTDDTL